MQRIFAELKGIDPEHVVTVTANTSIAYRHKTLTPAVTRTLVYDSTQDRINLTVGAASYPLIGGIEAFSLSASTADVDGDGNSDEIAEVGISFTMDGIGNPFQLQIYPRNLLPD